MLLLKACLDFLFVTLPPFLILLPLHSCLSFHHLQLHLLFFRFLLVRHRLFFFPGEGLRRDSGNSACSSSSNSSCSAHSSSIPSTSSLVSTVSNCCASATIAPVSVPSLSADLLYPLPPVPRVQRPWVRPVSHLPGGTRYPLRVEPAFGGRSKKQGSFDRGPDRCFSSSGGGVGSGYWRSHRPQKQRGQLHSRRRHFSHTAALNSSSSSTACSTAPIIVSTSSPSPFQKRRLAYQRFYNETVLSFPPVTEPEKTELVPTFPCYLPAPLNDPSTVPRPLRVPMPTLCRLDFGLPLPPPPPLGRPSLSHLLFSPPPPPVPPPPPFPPGPPRFADEGGGVRFWLSRLDRNRQAHAENGNTSSLASAPSVVSSSQSQSHFRSFLFSIPATSVPNHFDWFRDRFDWAVIRYACVGCHSCFWVSFPWGALRKDFFLFFLFFFLGALWRDFFCFFFLDLFLGLFSRDFFCFFFVVFLFCVVAGVHVPFFCFFFFRPRCFWVFLFFFFFGGGGGGGGIFLTFCPWGGASCCSFFSFFSSGAFLVVCFFFYFLCFFSYFLPSGRVVVLFFFLFLLLGLSFCLFFFYFLGFFPTFCPRSGASCYSFFSFFFLLGLSFCLFFFYFWVFLVVFSSPTGLSPCLCAGPECFGSHLVFLSRYFFCFFFGSVR